MVVFCMVWNERNWIDGIIEHVQTPSPWLCVHVGAETLQRELLVRMPIARPWCAINPLQIASGGVSGADNGPKLDCVSMLSLSSRA
jgi:hypothetical protein